MNGNFTPMWNLYPNAFSYNLKEKNPNHLLVRELKKT